MVFVYKGLGAVVVPASLLGGWAAASTITGQSLDSASILDLPPAGMVWMFGLSAIIVSAFLLASIPLRAWALKGYGRFLERDSSGLKKFDDGARWTMLAGPHSFMFIRVECWGFIYAALALAYALDLIA